MLVRELVSQLDNALLAVTAEHQREARLFAAYLLEIPLNQLNLVLTTSCPAKTEKQAAALLDRRRGGEPLQYIIGSEEFMSLEFKVGPAVLIPRADTEAVVERALELVTPLSSPLVADIGTGSGAIAVSIAHYHKGAQVCAVDISPEALAVAKENALQNQVASWMRFCLGDLCAPLEGKFDLIVSNPPYVTAEEMAELAREVRHEPETALFGGVDGLAVYRRLISQAYEHLAPGGYLLLEIGADQKQAVTELCREAGFVAVAGGKDLRGRHRFVEGKKSE